MKTRSLAFILAAFFIIGCSHSGYERSNRFSNELDSFAARSTDTQDAINEVIITLRDLIRQPSSDLVPQFRDYRRAVDAMQREADRFSSRFDDVARAGDEYFRTWEHDSTLIESADVRAVSEERRSIQLERYRLVFQSAEQIENDMQPFLSKLNDVKLYLDSDLTMAGINAASPFLSDVEGRGFPLRDRLEELDRQLTDLARSMRPTTDLGRR